MITFGPLGAPHVAPRWISLGHVAGILPGVMQNGRVQPRRVFVLGAGAIGASIGALLFEAGVDCVFVLRDNKHARAIAERGADLRFPKMARTIRCRLPLAEEAAEKRGVPGAMSARELRHRVLRSG